MVAVANGRTIGGGAELAPGRGARRRAGRRRGRDLDRPARAARLRGCAARPASTSSATTCWWSAAGTVTVTGDPFPVNADGELAGPVTARTWAVRPAAWSVLVPS